MVVLGLSIVYSFHITAWRIILPALCSSASVKKLKYCTRSESTSLYEVMCYILITTVSHYHCSSVMLHGSANHYSLTQHSCLKRLSYSRSGRPASKGLRRSWLQSVEQYIQVLSGRTANIITPQVWAVTVKTRILADDLGKPVAVSRSTGKVYWNWSMHMCTLIKQDRNIITWEIDKRKYYSFIWSRCLFRHLSLSRLEYCMCN